MTYFSPNYATTGWRVLYTPYCHGAHNLEKTFEGLCCSGDEGPSVKQRFKHLGAGIGMEIPLVNYIVFFAIRHFSSDAEEVTDDNADSGSTTNSTTTTTPPNNNTTPSGGGRSGAPSGSGSGGTTQSATTTPNNTIPSGGGGAPSGSGVTVTNKNTKPKPKKRKSTWKKGSVSLKHKKVGQINDPPKSTFGSLLVSSAVNPGYIPPSSDGGKIDSVSETKKDDTPPSSPSTENKVEKKKKKDKAKIGDATDIAELIGKVADFASRRPVTGKGKKRVRAEVKTAFDQENLRLQKEINTALGELSDADEEHIKILNTEKTKLQRLLFYKKTLVATPIRPRRRYEDDPTKWGKSPTHFFYEFKRLMIHHKHNHHAFPIDQIEAIKVQARVSRLGKADLNFVNDVFDKLGAVIDKRTYLSSEDLKPFLERVDAFEARLEAHCPKRGTTAFGSKQGKETREAFMEELNKLRDQLFILNALTKPDSHLRNHVVGKRIRELENLAPEKLVFRQYDPAAMTKLRELKKGGRKRKEGFYTDWGPHDTRNEKHPNHPISLVIKQQAALSQGANSLCGYYALYFMSQLIKYGPNAPLNDSTHLGPTFKKWFKTVYLNRFRKSDDAHLNFKPGPVDLQNITEVEMNKIISTDPDLAYLRDRDDIYFFRPADVTRRKGTITADKQFGAFEGEVCESVMQNPFQALGNVPLDQRKLQDTIYIIFKSEKKRHYVCLKVDGLHGNKWTFTYAHSAGGIISKGQGVADTEHLKVVDELMKLKLSRITQKNPTNLL